MAFRLEFETSNAAFEDSGEIARILNVLSNRVESIYPGDSGPVRDINGNTVGQWEYTGQLGD